MGEEEGRRVGEDEGSRIGEVELRVGDLIGLVPPPPDLASFLRGRGDNSMAANLQRMHLRSTGGPDRWVAAKTNTAQPFNNAVEMYLKCADVQMGGRQNEPFNMMQLPGARAVGRQ